MPNSSRLIPNHPVIIAALADLNAGKPLAPVVRNARDGAAEALYGLGGAGTRQGDELAALIYLRLALLSRPDHDLAAVTVANLFEDLKRSDEAIRAYDLVPTTSPMRESAEIQAALELDSLGRTDEATTKHAAPSSPLIRATPTPGARSAACSVRQEAYEDAAASYDKAIALLRNARPQQLDAVLFPRHLLRALQAMAEGGSRFQEGAGALSPTSRWC